MTSASDTIPQKLKAIIRHFHTGNLAEAERLCHDILTSDPANAEAHHLAGVIAYQAGDPNRGFTLIRRAIELNPDHPQAHYSLGSILQNMGHTAAAETSYRKALAILPETPPILNNLGNVLREKGELEQAAAVFEKALAVKPDYANAWLNLGNVLRELKRLDEAETCYRKAITIRPGLAESYNNLGILLRDRNRFNEAEHFFHQAIGLQPDNVDFHLNLGSTYRKSGRNGKAAACFRKGLDIDPDNIEANIHLGWSMKEGGSHRQAMDCFRNAIAIDPTAAKAHEALGDTCKDTGELEEAAACYRKAVECKPDFSVAHSSLLCVMNLLPTVTQKDIYTETLRWSRLHAKQVAARTRPFKNDMAMGRPLRIGYISADFRRHSMSFFIEPLIENHNRDRVEIYCYANDNRSDEVTERIRKNTDHWRLIAGLADARIAAGIEEDRIDILVDLSGHTYGNRLAVFAMNPAPIQVTWLGYVNTTGLTTMDYHLTDAVAMPEGEDRYYTETAYRLRTSMCCYRPASDSPGVANSPVGETGIITFGSVNNLTKINEEVVALWARILTDITDARLILQSVQLNDSYIRDRYLDLFHTYAIAPERIEMVAGLSRHDFLALHHRIDIALDPFPFNGLFTSCDSLWMGVPVLTLRGSKYCGRMAASLLTALGLEELIAESGEEYVTKAILLAADRDRLAGLRHSLRNRLLGSPVCDIECFAESVEDVYHEMWQKYLLQSTPGDYA